MMSVWWTALLLSALCWVALPCALALDNGLALTPPMGWKARFAFIGCNTDCTNNPNNCVSDRNIRKMADLMVSEGYLAAGYEYLILEDCWMGGMGQTIRNSTGHLQPDLSRFPHGIKALADYVHSKGLKFGIFVTGNIVGRSGDDDSTLKKDTATLAEWRVDYVKVDKSAYTGNSKELETVPYILRAKLLQTPVKKTRIPRNVQTTQSPTTVQTTQSPTTAQTTQSLTSPTTVQTTQSPKIVHVKPPMQSALKSWTTIPIVLMSIIIIVTLAIMFLECQGRKIFYVLLHRRRYRAYDVSSNNGLRSNTSALPI